MSKKSFVIGVVIGSVVGAVTSLLVAPKTGKELRTDIKRKSIETYDKSEPMREKGKEWVSIAKEKSASVKNAIASKVKKTNKDTSPIDGEEFLPEQ